MSRKHVFLALLLVAGALSLVRELASRDGVGAIEYATGGLLVALLLRGALGAWRAGRAAT